MKIFENGYLLNEFLNDSYRGIVGWEDIDNCTVVAIHGDETAYIDKGNNLETIPTDIITFKEFKRTDIPKGELCWFSDNGKTWYLSQFDRIYKESKNVNQFGASTTGAGKYGYDFKYCVPYLIAETAEEAEVLKDWHLLNN